MFPFTGTPSAKDFGGMQAGIVARFTFEFACRLLLR
jgi:hypothetical protein